MVINRLIIISFNHISLIHSNWMAKLKNEPFMSNKVTTNRKTIFYQN